MSLLILFSSFLFAFAGQKHALIIAVSKYKDKDIPFLSSETDAKILRKTILKLGFLKKIYLQ